MPNKEQKFDIYERIFNLIIEVLKFIDSLPRTYSNQVIIGQITRSVTSVGANSQEADGAFTKKDFIHCLIIVRKESKETVYWLKLIEKLNNKTSIKINPLIQEGSEIVAIISTIINKTLKNSSIR